MTNISQIKVDSDWGTEAARINQNFQNMNTDLEKVKSATTKFRGYFTSEAGLKQKYTSPKVGDTAWVGEPYPGTVYDVVTDGTWHNTGKAPDTDSVDLTDYAKKAEFDELEGKTSLLQNDTDKNTSEISETKAKVEENSSSIASLKLEKQDTLNFDAIPTLGSNNPVTSGGIRNALDEQKSEVDAAKEEAIQTINETEQSAITNFNAQRVTPEMLSESTKQLINTAGGGTINNLPDDEDLTSQDDGTGSNVLKLADRRYNPTNFSGKGYKILRRNIVDGKNILTQDMINKTNTVYEIRYDFNLNEQTITIPEGCTLKFEGGSISNGTLKGTNTRIIAAFYQIFDLSCKLSNTWDIDYFYTEWYGAKADAKVDCTNIFQTSFNLIFNSNITTFRLLNGIYKLTGTVIVGAPENIITDFNLFTHDAEEFYNRVSENEYIYDGDYSSNNSRQYICSIIGSGSSSTYIWGDFDNKDNAGCILEIVIAPTFTKANPIFRGFSILGKAWVDNYNTKENTIINRSNNIGIFFYRIHNAIIDDLRFAGLQIGMADYDSYWQNITNIVAYHCYYGSIIKGCNASIINNILLNVNMVGLLVGGDAMQVININNENSYVPLWIYSGNSIVVDGGYVEYTENAFERYGMTIPKLLYNTNIQIGYDGDTSALVHIVFQNFRMGRVGEIYGIIIAGDSGASRLLFQQIRLFSLKIGVSAKNNPSLCFGFNNDFAISSTLFKYDETNPTINYTNYTDYSQGFEMPDNLSAKNLYIRDSENNNICNIWANKSDITVQGTYGNGLDISYPNLRFQKIKNLQLTATESLIIGAQGNKIGFFGHAATEKYNFTDGETGNLRRLYEILSTKLGLISYDSLPSNWGTTGNRPIINNSSGVFQYFDTTLKKPIWNYNGVWYDTNGDVV